ncbi:hypothetical protein ANCCAN_13046 [Ancylostoma caninum]|uniref:Uncharacterized protein n=1 Tax=Ancylostoma caninum TaxID=29170 RepID=A0A368GCP0_ANCCA|nr:hypothetical protein ANCCAN_13046 [Ancylostoma caninum]
MGYQITSCCQLHVNCFLFVNKFLQGKTRVLLIGESVIGCVVPLVERHFWWRRVSDQGYSSSATDVHSEICLISLALLRLLSNNRRAKEQLISCDVLALCERIMNELDNEDLLVSSSASHLQDSLCALCLRCLPTLRFPIVGNTFPFKFRLHQPASPSKKRHSSKSPQKRWSDAVADTVAVSSSEMFDAESSDDDGGFEEDEVFMKFGEDAEAFTCDVDDEIDGLEKDVTHNQLKISELDSYSSFFAEYQNGARTKRRAASVPYPELFQQNAQSTRSVIPFHKIAFPEMHNPDVDIPRQPLCDNRTSMRDVVVHEIARARASTEFRHRVVYDLDSFACEQKNSRTPAGALSNNDRAR